MFSDTIPCLHDSLASVPHNVNSTDAAINQTDKRRKCHKNSSPSSLSSALQNFPLHLPQIIKAKAKSHTTIHICPAFHRADNSTNRAKYVAGVHDATQLNRAAEARYGHIEVSFDTLKRFFGSTQPYGDTRCNLNTKHSLRFCAVRVALCRSFLFVGAKVSARLQAYKARRRLKLALGISL